MKRIDGIVADVLSFIETGVVDGAYTHGGNWIDAELLLRRLGEAGYTVVPDTLADNARKLVDGMAETGYQPGHDLDALAASLAQLEGHDPLDVFQPGGA